MTIENTYFSSITLHGIELNLHLGWREAERLNTQVILVDVLLRFKTPPKACDTDNLDDTYCYDTLINTIITQTEPIEFRLIEHLGAHIYHLIKKTIPDLSAVRVSISKDPRHYIPCLTQGVAFTFGDEH